MCLTRPTPLQKQANSNPLFKGHLNPGERQANAWINQLQVAIQQLILGTAFVLTQTVKEGLATQGPNAVNSASGWCSQALPHGLSWPSLQE